MKDGDRHECELGRTLRGKRDDLRYSADSGGWVLSGQTFGDEEVAHEVTFCPWCGVRLPVGLASWPDPAEVLRSVTDGRTVTVTLHSPAAGAEVPEHGVTLFTGGGWVSQTVPRGGGEGR